MFNGVSLPASHARDLAVTYWGGGGGGGGRQGWGDAEGCLLVGWLRNVPCLEVSQGRACIDKCTCCHTEVKVADHTFYLTQSLYTDTGPISPSADPIALGT